MQITEEKILSEDLNLTEGLEIRGALIFAPEKSVTLTTSKNIVNLGKLVMRPARPDIVHTIRFVDVNEDKYQGGGMEVLDSDVGLWVMGSGVLDIQGSEKTAWTRAVAGIDAGNTFIQAINTTNWKLGDKVVIVPMSRGASNYDEREIMIEPGLNSFHVDKTTSHPKIDGLYTPEILNLTRNVRIEGTPGGHAHIFIHSQAVQSIKYLAIRYMGPRKNQLSDNLKELVPGRYGLHFHHCLDGSRGSIVEGVVVQDTNNHAFVPHTSHGITLKNCIAYNVMEDAYWWDLGDQTHDTAFIDCVAARLKYIRSIDMNLWAIDKSDKVPTLGVDGLTAGRGDGNKWIGGAIIGASGDPHAKGGINWIERDENHPEGVWEINGVRIHNCNCALRIWQNTSNAHVNKDVHCFSNGIDIHHGAYANSYEYRGGRFNGLSELKAASTETRQKWLGVEFNQVVMLSSPLSGSLPLLLQGCKWNSFDDQASGEVHSADIVNCEGPVKVSGGTGEALRVQPASGQAYRLTRSGKTNISPFAPKIWGEGTGLIGEYFTDADFQNKAFERLDINIAFGDWGNWIHYATPGPRLSARWGRDGGKILAQFSESYTFTDGGGGSMRLVIDGKEVIPFGKSSGKINLEAGKLYDILVEFRNNDTNVRGGANLHWNSPSLNLFSPGGEYVPSYCLYPGETTPPPPPPPNEKPTANAGPDFEITLPVDNAVLRGSGNDDDGTVVAYNWQKIEGGSAVILNPVAPVTAVNGLQEGTYRFRLIVTDNSGATASDDCVVVVKPEPIFNQPPSADAGPDVTLNRFVVTDGKATDLDGEIVEIVWRQESGPGTSVIENPGELKTVIKDFSENGTYKYILKVKDDKGAEVEDVLTVTVN